MTSIETNIVSNEILSNQEETLVEEENNNEIINSSEEYVRCKFAFSSDGETYHQDGCPASFLRSEIIGHETVCPYKIIFNNLAEEIKVDEEYAEADRELDETAESMIILPKVNSSSLPCPHTSWGCSFTGPSTKVAAHLSDCEYEKLKSILAQKEIMIHSLEHQITELSSAPNTPSRTSTSTTTNPTYPMAETPNSRAARVAKTKAQLLEDLSKFGRTLDQAITKAVDPIKPHLVAARSDISKTIRTIATSKPIRNVRRGARDFITKAQAFFLIPRAKRATKKAGSRRGSTKANPKAKITHERKIELLDALDIPPPTQTTTTTTATTVDEGESEGQEDESQEDEGQAPYRLHLNNDWISDETDEKTPSTKEATFEIDSDDEEAHNDEAVVESDRLAQSTISATSNSSSCTADLSTTKPTTLELDLDPTTLELTSPIDSPIALASPIVSNIEEKDEQDNERDTTNSWEMVSDSSETSLGVRSIPTTPSSHRGQPRSDEEEEKKSQDDEEEQNQEDQVDFTLN